jgi:nucleoside-diphosphate-sugar epimerase
MNGKAATPRPPEERLVLVVGGAGYLGTVLTDVLLRRGYRVRVLDSLLYGHGASLAADIGRPGFSFVRGDLRHAPAVASALDGVTDVALLASLVGDPICRKYPDLARSVNQEATIRLFEELDGRSLGRFVFTSTCSNYGLMPGDAEATEESELHPQSLYAETKVAVERHIASRAAQVDFVPTILRLSTAYGFSPRMRFDLTIAEFTRELALGRELLVYDESTWRPYCHTRDIARAVAAVLQAEASLVDGEIFNVGSSTSNFTKKMVVELAQARTGRGSVAYKSGGRDTRNYRVSFRKIQSVLGFTTEHTVEGFVSELISAIDGGMFADVDARREFFGNYEIRGAEAS